MKTIKYLALTLAGVFFLAVSCSDDKELVPIWESGINGEGTVTSAATDFKRGNLAVVLDFDLKWISVDSKGSVTKMEVFLSWKESYTDSDGNPAIADHGTKPIETFEGGAVPANRGTVAFSLSQNDVLALYAGATYDYGDGVGARDVFANPKAPTRDGANPLIDKDAFTITWQFTAADGRVFSAWSPSVCTEFPGSNCQIDFGVVCAEDIPLASIAGDWKFDMVDTYGDGWQGGYIGIIVDGVEVDKAFLYSQYDPGGVPLSAGSYTYTAAGSVTTLSFEWNDDNYNSECQFKITSPKGNVVANVTTVSAGAIKLNLCSE